MNKNKMSLQPEVYDLIVADIKKANENISHEKFITGAKNGTMGFRVMFGEPSQLLYGLRKAIFNFLVMMYMGAPILLVPFCSFVSGRLWLLVGIGFSYLFTHFAIWKDSRLPSRWKSYIIVVFGLICIVYWIMHSFYFFDYLTFFFFCSLWGHIFFRMAENAQHSFAMKVLIENKDAFNAAVEKNIIKIFGVEDELMKENEWKNWEIAKNYLDQGREKDTEGDYSGAVMAFSQSIEISPCTSAFGDRASVKI